MSSNNTVPLLNVNKPKINYKNVAIGVAVAFVIILIIVIVLVVRRKKKKSGPSVLEQATEVKKIIDDNDVTQVAKVKAFCEIKREDIPDDAKAITDEIYALTSNCQPVDCTGEWSEFTECEGNCFPVSRTYTVVEKGNILGKACEVEDGGKETKKCDALFCDYTEVPFGGYETGTILMSEEGDLESCKTKCNENSNCHMISMTDGKMCVFKAVPDDIESIDFEYSTGTTSYVTPHLAAKVKLPDAPPGE